MVQAKRKASDFLDQAALKTTPAKRKEYLDIIKKNAEYAYDLPETSVNPKVDEITGKALRYTPAVQPPRVSNPDVATLLAEKAPRLVPGAAIAGKNLLFDVPPSP